MTQNPPSPSPGRVFDEFSPKKLILQVQGLGRYILGKWWKILLAGLLLGLAAAIYTYFKKPNFLAEITFVIDEEATQASKSTLPSLREELGLEPSADAGSFFSSVTNIVELMQSRLLIEKTLRRSISLHGKTILFADFFLDSLEYREKWMEGSPYYRVNFSAAGKPDPEKLYENSIMRNIYEVIKARIIKIDAKGKGSSIISVTCISEHQLFSKYFLEAWLDEVTQYYTEIKTQRARINLELIQKRTDSVRMAYNNALYTRASFTDAHLNPIRQTVNVSTEKQQTDVQILRASYTELVQTLEMAKTNLMKDTPLIQYLDTPILPLKVMKSSLMKRFILLFIVGAFLATAYYAVMRIYRRILEKE
jgi:hypothetical protein